jgi:hypothetical protein
MNGGDCIFPSRESTMRSANQCQDVLEFGSRVSSYRALAFGARVPELRRPSGSYNVFILFFGRARWGMESRSA